MPSYFERAPILKRQPFNPHSSNKSGSLFELCNQFALIIVQSVWHLKRAAENTWLWLKITVPKTIMVNLYSELLMVNRPTKGFIIWAILVPTINFALQPQMLSLSSKIPGTGLHSEGHVVISCTVVLPAQKRDQPKDVSLSLCECVCLTKNTRYPWLNKCMHKYHDICDSCKCLQMYLQYIHDNACIKHNLHHIHLHKSLKMFVQNLKKMAGQCPPRTPFSFSFGTPRPRRRSVVPGWVPAGTWRLFGGGKLVLLFCLFFVGQKWMGFVYIIVSCLINPF